MPKQLLETVYFRILTKYPSAKLLVMQTPAWRAMLLYREGGREGGREGKGGREGGRKGGREGGRKGGWGGEWREGEKVIKNKAMHACSE